jgi:hypothetical protein
MAGQTVVYSSLGRRQPADVKRWLRSPGIKLKPETFEKFDLGYFYPDQLF